MLKATVDFVTSDPWVHFRSSIQRVLLGYAGGVGVGDYFLGVLIGWFEVVEDSGAAAPGTAAPNSGGSLDSPGNFDVSQCRKRHGVYHLRGCVFSGFN